MNIVNWNMLIPWKRKPNHLILPFNGIHMKTVKQVLGHLHPCHDKAGQSFDLKCHWDFWHWRPSLQLTVTVNGWTGISIWQSGSNSKAVIGHLVAMPKSVNGNLVTMPKSVNGNLVAMPKSVNGNLVTMPKSVNGNLVAMPKSVSCNLVAMLKSVGGNLVAIPLQLVSLHKAVNST